MLGSNACRLLYTDKLLHVDPSLVWSTPVSYGTYLTLSLSSTQSRGFQSSPIYARIHLVTMRFFGNVTLTPFVVRGFSSVLLVGANNGTDSGTEPRTASATGQDGVFYKKILKLADTEKTDVMKPSPLSTDAHASTTGQFTMDSKTAGRDWRITVVNLWFFGGQRNKHDQCVVRKRNKLNVRLLMALQWRTDIFFRRLRRRQTDGIRCRGKLVQ